MACGLYVASCAPKRNRKAPEYCPKENALDRSSIVFQAFVDRGILPDFGQTSTVAGIPIINDFANLAQSLRQLELLGKADVFPMDTISGTYSGSEQMESETYGTQDNPDFSQLKAKFDFKWKNHYTERNVAFINSMRGNHNDKDVVMFTHNTFTDKGSVLMIKNRRVSVMSSGYKIDGDYSKNVSGGYSIETLLNGDLVPVKGYNIAALYNELRLTLAASVLSAGVTSNSALPCIGDCITYNVATGGGTITFPVVEATTCLCYSVYQNEDSPLTGALLTQIKVSNLGVLSIDGALPAGEYKLNVVVSNQQGHTATQCIKIIKL